MLNHFGPQFPLAVFRSGWAELWDAQAARHGIATKPGLAEFLVFLEERQLPVAIATSSDRSYTETSLTRAGLDGRFKVIVTGDQVAKGKPAPDIYLEAARCLRVNPPECVALAQRHIGL